MTDADLLALLTEKSPRDFSPAELAALRERWPQSTEVRQALLDQLQLETDLFASLSDVTLTVDQLLARAARRPRSSRVRTGVAWLLIGLFAIGIGAWWLRESQRMPQRSEDESPFSQNAVAPEATMPNAAADVAAQVNTSAAAALDSTQTASIATTVEPAAAPSPWSPWLVPDAMPEALGSSRMIGDLKSIGHDELPLDEFRRWWADAPSQPGNWNQTIVGLRRTVQLNGAARLRAPWLPDTWLRITPFEVQDLSLMFWAGDTGIALQFYRNREPHLWAAFAVERLPGTRVPHRWGLLCTDSGKVYRSGVATLEFHHHAGMLVMSVAQTPVLAAPLSSAPDEVVMQGQLRLRGATWLRAAPIPSTLHAHSLAWDAVDHGPPVWPSLGKVAANIETNADDETVTLRAEPSKDMLAGLAQLPQSGLYEVTFRITSGDPGTGVVLGDAAGKPIALLGLLRERRTGQLTIAGMRPEERRTESDYDSRSFPAPYTAAQQWVRLTAGLGTLQVCVSGDEEHWGHVVESPIRDIRGAVQSVGLFAFPSDKPRAITVNHLMVRRLDHINAIVDEKLREGILVDATKLPRDLTRWQQQALEQRPSEVTTSAWLDAFAVATLNAGPAPELAAVLVDRLAESAAARDVPHRAIWSCFDDQLQIQDHWPERDAAAWSARYATIGRKSTTTLREAWSAWLQSPMWTHGAVRDEYYRGLVNELLELTEGRQWDDLDRLSRFSLHVVAQSHPDHQPRDAAKTLEQIARWSRGVGGESEHARRDNHDEVFPTSWRHPFTPQLDKDAYNTRAELQAALDSAAYRDAARIALTLGQSTPSGLLPDVREPNLFVSLPVALARAWHDHPAFAETMRTEVAETGLLRVRQATQIADAEALRAITLQFHGTAAAAEAHVWFGDQRMALGEFAAAWRYYEQALPCANDEQKARLVPKWELARALTGPLPGEPASATSVPATKFLLEGQDLATVIQDLRPTLPALSSDLLSHPPVLTPQRYRLEPRARFDGQSGNNAGQGEFRETDAFGRQFAVAADAKHIYVNNRFQVTAYDRAQAQSRWAVAVGSEQGSAHAHRFMPMTPLVVANSLYVRRLTKAGIELACLDATNGNVRWHSRPGDRAQWLSDPVWTANGLWALAVHKLDDEWLELRWSRINAESGAMLEEAMLFRLRDAWQSEVPCRLAVRGWNVVATVGGTVACFGLDGEVHWIRQELWLPPKIDPLADDYVLPVPLISDGDVVVSQPASRCVQCLDLSTGQTKWKHTSAGMQGLLAATSKHVIVAEKGAISACDRASGAPLWTRRIDHRLMAISANPETVVVTRELEFKTNRGWLQLVWLDADTGEVEAEVPVDTDVREDWRFGPWFTTGDQSWAFAGQTWRDPNRDLVALSPIAGSAAGPWEDPALGVWQSALAIVERRAAQIVLPGWSPLSVAKDAISVASGEVRGRTPVLVCRLKKDEELHFLRHVAVPEQGATNLFLRVGHQPGQSWRLQVRVDARMVVDQMVDESVSANGWVEHFVALGPSTGRATLVQVAQRSAGDKTAEGLWHQLQIKSQ